MFTNAYMRRTATRGDLIEINKEDLSVLASLTDGKAPLKYTWSTRSITNLILPHLEDNEGEGNNAMAQKRDDKVYWNDKEMNIANKYKSHMLQNPAFYMPSALCWLRPETGITAAIVTFIREMTGISDIQHIRHYASTHKGLQNIFVPYWKFLQTCYHSGCTAVQIPIELRQEAYQSGAELLLRDL